MDLRGRLREHGGDRPERVDHVWFVDPVAKTLEVFRREQQRFYVVKVWRDEAVVRAEPFEAIEIALADLWQR